MNTLPVRKVFISPSSRRVFCKREHENLIFLQHFERLTDDPQRTVCLQGSYSVRAAGIPKGTCISKQVGCYEQRSGLANLRN